MLRQSYLTATRFLDIRGNKKYQQKDKRIDGRIRFLRPKMFSTFISSKAL